MTDTTGWAEEFKKFCKKRNWSPTNMGVEIDHYRDFTLSLLATQKREIRQKVEGMVRTSKDPYMVPLTENRFIKDLETLLDESSSL